MKAFILVVAVLLILAGTWMTYRKRFKQEQEELPDDTPANDEITFVTHRGFTLSHTQEEHVVWENMSHKEKNDHVQKVRKALKIGSHVAVPRPNGEKGWCILTEEHALLHKLQRVEVKGVKYERSWPHGTIKRGF